MMEIMDKEREHVAKLKTQIEERKKLRMKIDRANTSLEFRGKDRNCDTFFERNENTLVETDPYLAKHFEGTQILF